MRILCVSDLVDPLVYSTSVKSRFGDVDLVVSAGDLPMEYLGFIVTCINKPLLFVYGNHNLGELDRGEERGWIFGSPEFGEGDGKHGAEYIGFRTRTERGLLFMGLGGCMRYNGGPNQYGELAMSLRIAALFPALLANRLLRGRWLDVLVTHAPPEGIHDANDLCHRGFRCYRWFMKTFKPKLLIHGHVHLYDRNDRRETVEGGTLVVNAYGHHIVTIGEDGDA